MTNSNQMLWPNTALLIATLLTIGMWVPLKAAYAETISPAKEQAKIKVRMEEENKLIKTDPSHKKYAMAMAKHYANSAKLVARQGGDPKPLLDAAAYYAKQAK